MKNLLFTGKIVLVVILAGVWLHSFFLSIAWTGSNDNATSIIGYSNFAIFLVFPFMIYLLLKKELKS